MLPFLKTNRRHFLGLAAGAVGAALVPGCRRHYPWQVPPAVSASSLGVRAGYRPRVSSVWVPRGEHEDAYAQFVRLCEAATDFSWLSRGDRVFVKLSINSKQRFPATSDPWTVHWLTKLLLEKGAGSVTYGDQSGMANVYVSETRTRGSSRICADRADLLSAIEQSGAQGVFFDELGYDAFVPSWPSGEHHWPEPPWIPALLNEVDHVIYLCRVSTHALADVTLGLKLSVGWMRCDSRFVFHKGGKHFDALYDEVHDCPEIASRLRLVISSGREVLSTIGPDSGHVARPDHGLLLASEDLLAHELLAHSWLRYNREFHTPRNARSLDFTVLEARPALNRLLMQFVGTREQHAGIPDIPQFRAGRVHDHPAALNRMRRLGGRPESVQWEQLDPAPDPVAEEFVARELGLV